MQDADPAAELRTAPREILVAGTAGRSSTAAMIASILVSAGQPVVRIDAGYVHSPEELLTLNGAPLPPGTLPAAPTPADAKALDAWLAGALDLLLVSEKPAWIVRSGTRTPGETANLLVFTPVLPTEHSAGANASALLEGLPRSVAAVSSLQRESVLDVLRPAYGDLVELALVCRLSRGQSSLEGQEFRLKTPLNEYRVRLQLTGAFQAENAATAILAVEQLAASGVVITPAAVSAALAELRLPARCEIVKRQPLVIVDAASTQFSLQRVCEAVRELAGGRRVTLILDLSAGLPPAGAVEAASRLRPDLVVSLGAAPPEVRDALRHAAYEQGLPLQLAADTSAAVDAALGGAGDRDVICVAGSRRAAATARAQILGLTPADAGLNYTGT